MNINQDHRDFRLTLNMEVVSYNADNLLKWRYIYEQVMQSSIEECMKFVSKIVNYQTNLMNFL